MHFRSTRPASIAMTLLALSLSAAIHAQEAPPPTASDWGVIGLLQTPTARMAEQGDIAFTASHTSPYSRYNVTMQPFPWLEGAFRYMSVANRRYGSEWLSGDQNYKDKSIDFKLRLWEETRWTPQLAFGMRDVGGTGLFSSEYLVASKNVGPIDASLGIATGYIGNRGDFANPLRHLDDRFETRGGTGSWGSFSTSAMFRGPVGIFGGISYQTPWEPLLLKVEYDGNDYKREPQRNNQRQDSPINVAAVYTATKNIQLALGLERGNTALFAITFRGNPAHTPPMPKIFDPAPESLTGPRASAPTPDMLQPSAQEETAVDWDDVARRLRVNAGFRVNDISRAGKELIVTGQQARYYYHAQGIGRSARILHNSTPETIEWFTFVDERLGMKVAQTSIERDTFIDRIQNRASTEDLRLATELSAPVDRNSELLYKAPFQRFGGGFNIGYGQNLGGPDGFILYQVSANYSASYFLARNFWATGTVRANVINNYDKFKYDAPSRLQRVRTDLRQYMTESDVTMPNLQLTASAKLGNDVYGMAYAGYLEWMYAGVGGEVLYRPMGERWAIGTNINWVRQRDYDQGFGLRDYSVATGHTTLYYAFGRDERVLASVSAGRYLAGDWGATFDVARIFDNGVTMGAYFTKTNVSSREFGEGSFDKGIYFSIPFDSVLPRSTRGSANILWQPLTRDGGAMLGRKYALYPATSERNSWFLQRNFDKIAD